MIAAGIGITLFGILLFAINDAIGKWVLATYSLGQLLLIRALAGLVMLSPVVMRTGWAPFRNLPQPGLQLIRVVLAALESAMFFGAVIFLPLADVTTVYLAAPIFVTILAMFFLGERVGWWRWSAILIGFLGVVLALGPSGGIASLPALIALAGSIVFAILIIITRQLRATPDITLLVFQFIGAAILGLIIAPFGWRELVWYPDVLVIIMLGALSLGAHFSINRSLKWAPASTVAPFHYTLIVWAVIFGVIFFDDIPSPLTVAGALLVIVSGLVIFFREHRKTPDLTEH